MSLQRKTRAPRTTRRLHRLLSGVAAGVLIAVGAAGTAQAEFGVGGFDGAVKKVDGSGETQAGAHPAKATTVFDITSPNEDLRDTIVDLPAGFVGDPSSVVPCREALAQELGCPAKSQVGIVTLKMDGGSFWWVKGLYLMEPAPGTIAQFTFEVITIPTKITVSLRPGGDYGVRATVIGAPQSFKISGVRVTLWGNPYGAENDSIRAEQGAQCYPFGDTEDPAFDPATQCSGEGPMVGERKRALVTNPSNCSAGPLATTLRANSWDAPGTYKSLTFLSHDDNVPAAPIGVTGCDKLVFEPEVSTQLTTDQPDAPAGLKVNLHFPQEGLSDPGALAPPPLKTAVVTLPEGMTINPAAASGLEACTDAQLDLTTVNPLACPEASKVGTVTATTPVLKETLKGDLYIRSQASGDPASGEMFRMALVLRNQERGIDVRLGGQIKVDPATGRIVTVFDNNPQLPVENIELTLKSGSRAPLVTPQSCGEKSITTQLTSWAGQSVTRTSPFTIACRPGLGGFGPTVQAGTERTTGGAFSPFSLAIAKPDGQAPLSGLGMTLPTGLLASLKRNLNTQVGTVKAFAGPGATPFTLPGKVFLEGAYGDAPFSLKVVVPAKAGPFDLGEVVVRQKIYVDPITAQVTVVSDPVPTIVKGVPVRLQRLEVNVDKRGFVINPTSCAAKALGGTLSAADGQTAPINVRFQASDCASLDVKPRLALSLSGKGQTRDGGHPAVSATLSQPAGGANLKKVMVKLPLSLALDPDNAESDSLCSFMEGSKPDPKCPASSVVGKATAVSPILNEPLTGPVYFVKNERKDPKSGRSIKTTPKLVIPLVGENGVKLVLTGTSTVVDDKLVTTFDNIPDAPVSSFKMDINGGKKGILVVSGDKVDICKSTQIAEQQVDGQNNKQADTDVYIQTPSCPTKIISKTVGKTSVKLKVGGLGAGKVTVTGRGIKKTTKTISKSTVATITAKRTKGKPGKVTVSFDPAGPAKARKATK